MIFKLIMFAIIGFMIYKLLGGKLLQIPKNSVDKEKDDDTLVECTTCHTYATAKDSIIASGKYYCSKECLH